MSDSSPAGEPLEVEAKLRGSERAFRALQRLDQIAGWSVVERRTVRLRDTYWDTPERRLGAQGCTLRVREQDGGPRGELTFKGRANYGPDSPAVARAEITAAVPAGSDPTEWARLPEARPVLAALRASIAAGASAGVGEARRSGATATRTGEARDDSGTARLREDVVLLNPRRELVLRLGGGASGEWSEAVLSLDEVRIEGQPYRRRYVEIELKRGARPAFDRLVHAVAAQVTLRPIRTGKVQAARIWLARHDGAGGARAA